MATSMHVVWKSEAAEHVVYETYSIEVVEDGGAHGEVVSNRHDTVIRSRAHAREIAAEHGYELFSDGDAWGSLPEEG
ncbi:hypothetical protein OG948_51325 (plasmid) [Embleya sp. NBC_00888]|uniref:hypothetical protein n=1 Tax=Embleya sp. NBC_00888 TaxID=2975960 RepID=UPI002F906974|nr:hypothetical protein OG948_51325 [Embleya sp. NBC_00888]